MPHKLDLSKVNGSVNVVVDASRVAKLISDTGLEICKRDRESVLGVYVPVLERYFTEPGIGVISASDVCFHLQRAANRKKLNCIGPAGTDVKERDPVRVYHNLVYEFFDGPNEEGLRRHQLVGLARQVITNYEAHNGKREKK